MKFLTEDDLRVEYHQFPFDTFTIKKHCRLTPGARTFLLDRKVQIVDENEIKAQGRHKKFFPINRKPLSSLKEEKENWMSDPYWLDLRCEFLQVAVDLAPVDIVLAQELTALERCLATILAGGECCLPPMFNGEYPVEKVDKSFIIGNLSNIGMFLQTTNGRVLTKLYPLYLHLDVLLEQWRLQDQNQMADLLERLGQFIAYYLQTREEVNKDVTNTT